MKETPISTSPSYPFGLACAPMELHTYTTAVYILDFAITPDTHETIALFVYHQPFQNPRLSFQDVRYIHAAEMVPYDPDIASPRSCNSHQLRTLIQQKTSRISGFTITATRPSWPIYPQGTILADPLAPSR